MCVCVCVFACSAPEGESGQSARLLLAGAHEVPPVAQAVAAAGARAQQAVRLLARQRPVELAAVMRWPSEHLQHSH